MSKTNSTRQTPASRLIRAQLKAGLVCDVYLDGKLVKCVTAVNVNRRLLTVAVQNEKGLVFANSKGRGICMMQVSGDITIQWRRVKP